MTPWITVLVWTLFVWFEFFTTNQTNRPRNPSINKATRDLISNKNKKVFIWYLGENLIYILFNIINFEFLLLYFKNIFFNFYFFILNIFIIFILIIFSKMIFNIYIFKILNIYILGSNIVIIVYNIYIYIYIFNL